MPEFLSLLGTPGGCATAPDAREFLRSAASAALRIGARVADPGSQPRAGAAAGRAKRASSCSCTGRRRSTRCSAPSQTPGRGARRDGVAPDDPPGVRFCDGLPRTAAVAHEMTVVRSMTHPYPVHGVAYAVSGIPVRPVPGGPGPRRPHWPFIGSVVDYPAERVSAGRAVRGTSACRGCSTRSRTSWSTPAVRGVPRASVRYPIWTDFTGCGASALSKYTEWQAKEFIDLFGGCTGRPVRPVATPTPADLPAARLDDRRSLLARRPGPPAATWDVRRRPAPFDLPRAGPTLMACRPCATRWT